MGIIVGEMWHFSPILKPLSALYRDIARDAAILRIYGIPGCSCACQVPINHSMIMKFDDSTVNFPES